MSAIAIITARGGSKRIPRKNIRPFLGRPVIHYPIAAALESGLFELVIVSTDDPEIAAVAVAAGAEVPFLRSAKNSDDYATTADVLNEVLEWYGSSGRSFTSLCCIYPTAPFVTADKLKVAFEMMTARDADSVFPVVQHSHPLYRSLLIKDELISPAFPEYENVRSQDLPATFYDAGQYYWLNAERFTRSAKIYTGNSVPLVVSEMEVQDIDSEADWIMAELKYGILHG
ncbi:MAG: pseudaminic acid cytidylyltransferase [Chitinophagaceae bacterium]|nr:MAG: pseudaminic acid cytidylyltransferase [Chitinophagaceae bacterium]